MCIICSAEQTDNFTAHQFRVDCGRFVGRVILGCFDATHHFGRPIVLVASGKILRIVRQLLFRANQSVKSNQLCTIDAVFMLARLCDLFSCCLCPIGAEKHEGLLAHGRVFVVVSAFGQP